MSLNYHVFMWRLKRGFDSPNSLTISTISWRFHGTILNQPYKPTARLSTVMKAHVSDTRNKRHEFTEAKWEHTFIQFLPERSFDVWTISRSMVHQFQVRAIVLKNLHNQIAQIICLCMPKKLEINALCDNLTFTFTPVPNEKVHLFHNLSSISV